MTIETAKQVLIDNGYVHHFWHSQDIQLMAELYFNRNLTESEIIQVKDLLALIDPNMGINFNVITKQIEKVLGYGTIG